jgi:hypothetical protein
VLATAAALGMLVMAAMLDRPEAGIAIAQRTAAAYDALPPQERARTTVMGSSYIVAAYLDGYGSPLGLPPAHSTNRAYGYFPPPPDDQDAALYVGADPVELRPYFAAVREVGQDTWLCTGRQQPWSMMWPRLRNLTV